MCWSRTSLSVFFLIFFFKDFDDMIVLFLSQRAWVVARRKNCHGHSEHFWQGIFLSFLSWILWLKNFFGLTLLSFVKSMWFMLMSLLKDLTPGVVIFIFRKDYCTYMIWGELVFCNKQNKKKKSTSPKKLTPWWQRYFRSPWWGLVQ